MIFFILFVGFLSVALLALNLLLAPSIPYAQKAGPFECGFSSFLGQNRSEFNISFFVFGLLFLLFDLEILLVYPYAVSSYNNSAFGLFFLIIFLLILTAGFVFEFARGALEIKSKQTGYLESSDIEYKGPRGNLYTPQLKTIKRYYSTRRHVESSIKLNTKEDSSDEKGGGAPPPEEGVILRSRFIIILIPIKPK
jgi:NADH-ubiquinone oxidoreductase chain 3